MKQIIKVKVLTEGCLPVISEDGDWIDFRAAEDVHLDGPYAVARTRKGGESTRKVIFTTKNIPLGVAMELPKGMEALVVPRSSTFKKYKIMQTNSIGVIDGDYNGDNDQWFMPVIAIEDTFIPKNDRICQFRILKNQDNANLVTVTELGNEDRKGFGSTGRD